MAVAMIRGVVSAVAGSAVAEWMVRSTDGEESLTWQRKGKRSLWTAAHRCQCVRCEQRDGRVWWCDGCNSRREERVLLISRVCA